MKTVTVSTSKTYEIKICAGILSQIGIEAAALGKASKVCIVSDSNVFPLYGQKVTERLQEAGFTVGSYVFPAGEQHKNAETFLSLLNELASMQLTRTDLIVALGGGVVGDLAGFAAACYLRGIRFIQVPTTLLAAVDSSVGGKTAIDLAAGKNLAGAFWQPSLVLCDTDTLNTLPQEIFRDGCAEVIKYAILYDPALFKELMLSALDFDRESVIARCVEWKRDVVMEDEFDTGSRMKLNLGHTIGHGVEARSEFAISHGQGVSIGMAIVAFVLATSLNEYMKRNIVEKLHKINSSLTAITQGDLNQVVDVRNIYELSELSTHINTMVQSLFSSNAKLTYVLSKTNFYLGTYEYINDGDRVHFSEYIPKLFSLDEKTAKKFSSNPDDFKNFLNEIQKHEVMGEPNIYELAGKYLKIDEIMDIDYVLGVVMDVTNTIQKRKKLELEVHLDPLTGLYNRKGLEAKLAELFSSPETLEYYAIIMIMADGLININTTYGSDYGDIYLQKLAGIITDFGIRNSIAARQWGGEFILFLYGYQNENELSKSINLLSYLQEHSLTHLDDNMDVPLEFSFMYYSSNGSECSDYRELLKKIK